MKKSYQLLCLLLTLSFFSTKSLAQNNNLAAGDVAIVSYQSDFDPTNPIAGDNDLAEFEDRFSLVVLRPGGIPAGTVLYFTTRGWNAVSNNWHDVDFPPNTFGLGRRAVVQWTVPAGGIAAGTEIFFISTYHDEVPVGSEYYSWAAYANQAGTVLINNLTNVTPIVPAANSTDGMGLSFSGDHLIVYQTGPTAGPAGGPNATPIRFITALHANDNGTTTYAAWDAAPGAVNSESSLPPGLVNGQTAFLMSPSLPGEWDNGKFNACALSSAGACSALQLSTIIYTTANWTYSNSVFPLGTSSSLCTYSILPTNTITLTSAAGTNNQTRCINTAITNITYSTTGATGATFSGLPAGVTGSWAANVVTISGSPTTTVGSPFNYTVTLTGGCGTVTATGTITVTPNNTISLTSAAGTNAQTVCINTPITNITYSTTGATGATFSGLPAGVTGSWAANVVTISGSPTTTVGSPFSYTVTLTGGCGTVTATGTITVTGLNTITLTSAAGTNNQSVLVNTAITNITYSTTNATGATFSGLPAGVTGSWAANVVTISGSPTTAVGSPFNYTVTLTGGCGTVTATGTITVTTCSAVNQTVTASPTSVCSGGSSTITVGASQPGINYTLRLDPSNTVVAGPTASNGPAINFSTGPIVSATTYNVLAETDKYSVYLDGNQSGPAIPQHPALDVTDNFTVEGWIKPDGNTNYARLYNKDNCFALGISSNQTQLTFTRHFSGDFSRPFTFVSGTWYHIACTYVSGTVELFVNGTSIGTVSGVPAIATSAAGGHLGSDAGGSFNQFRGNLDNVRIWSSVRTQAEISANQNAFITSTGNPSLVASWWVIEGTGNVNDYSANAINSTSLNAVWQTDAPVAPCSIVLTNKPTVSITPNNTITLTSAAGTNAQTVCINAPITNITYSTTGATGATFSGLPAGVTGNWAANVVTISGTPTTTVGSPFSYTVTLTGGCGTITATGTITVNPLNTITLTSAAGTNAQTVCENTPITNITYATTGATGATFSGLPAGVTGNWAANVVTISGTPTTTVGSPFSYTVTLTGGCGTVTATGTITVNPNNSITLTSATGTDAQTVCINTPITNITYSTTGATGASFSGLPAGVTGNWAANVVTISGTPSTAVGSPFSYTVTLTGGGSCGTLTATGIITVNPTPTVNAVSNQVICNNTATAAVNFSGTPPGVVFNWTNSDPSIGLAPSGTGNIASFTATNATNAPIVATVTVTPQTSSGGASNSISMPGQSTTNTPNVRGYFFTAPTNFTITSLYVPTDASSGNQSIAVVRFDGNTPPPVFNAVTNAFTTLYLTQNNVTPGNIPVSIPISTGEVIGIIGYRSNVNSYGNGSGGITIAGFPVSTTRMGMQFPLTTTAPQDLWQEPTSTNISRVVFEYTSPVVCTGTPQTFTYTVNPTPNAVATPATQTICSGSAITNIALTGNVAGTVYNWTRDNPVVTGIANSGSGDISGTLTNNTFAPITVTFTITPAYTNAGTTCTGTPITATVIVNPIPAMAQPGNQTVCNGAPTTAVVFSGSVPGTVYDWTNNDPSIGLAASGSGDIASFTATNTGNAPVTAIITVTPNYTNAGQTCSGTPRTFSITVNPTPTVNAVPNQTVCNGSPTTAVNFTSPATGGTIVYNWTNNTPSIGLAASGTGNIASFTAINATNAPVTATITVTPSYTNGVTCAGTPSTFTITVDPTPDVAQPASQVICNNAPTAPVTFTGTVAGTVFNWTNNDPSIGLAASGTGNIASFTATNTTNAPVVATVTVTPSASGGAGSGLIPEVLYYKFDGTGTSVPNLASAPPAGTATATLEGGLTQGGAAICDGTIIGTGNSSSTDYLNTGWAPNLGSGSWSISFKSENIAPSAILYYVFGDVNTNSFRCFTNGVAGPNNWILRGGGLTDTYINGGATVAPHTNTFVYDAVLNEVRAYLDGVLVSTVAQGAPNLTGAGPFKFNGYSTNVGSPANGHYDEFKVFSRAITPAEVLSLNGCPPVGPTCTGAPKTFTYTVNPTPVVNPVANQIVCNGAPTTAVNFTSPTTGGTIVYNWTNNTPSIGLAASGSGNIASFTAINTGAVPVVATITVTPDYTNGSVTCTGSPITFTITVNPSGQVDQPANQVICNNSPTAPVNFTTTVPGTIFNWTNSNPSIGLAASGTGNIASFTGTNAGNAPAVATITVTPQFVPVSTATQTFAYTGAMQTFTVPAGVTSITINSYGAQGGSGAAGSVNGGAGGLGSRATGTLAVTPGQVLNIFVGGAGTTGTGGFNGGGTGGNQNAGGGGGASDVRYPGTSTADRIIVGAGGGGGGRGGCESGSAGIGGVGGTGDGNGANGGDSPTSGGVAGGGFGGVGSNFGGAGIGCGGFLGAPGVAGIASGIGGNGGAGQACCCFSFGSIPGGGAGGGGYVGGGGAGGGSAGTAGCSGNDKGAGGGGAGGSSYTGSLTAPSITSGVQSGDGQVVITYAVPGGSSCNGPAKTFTITVNPTPQVDQPANQVVCNNTTTAPTNFTTPTTGGTVTYAWTNNNTTIGLGASGTGNIPAFTGTNTTNAPNVATVTVTPSITTPAPAVSGSQSFAYTGAMQTFTVPAGVTSITINSYGAQGGSGAAGSVNGGAGGLGSRATGTLAVTPGQVLNIFVGGAGTTGTGGFNGGGSGGSSNAGGGGGASDVRYPGTSTADRIIVGAGGGGGGRGGCESGSAGIGGVGGTGDGNGANGGDSPTSGGVAGGGFGGVGSNFGGAGIGCGGFLGAPGVAGIASGIGGNGGAGQACCCFSFGSIPGGGAGGGGYVGGGGAGGGSAGTAGCSGNDKGAGGGGAGGSSYTGSLTAPSITSGVQSGDGQVVVTWTSAGTLTCVGTPKTFTYTVNPTAIVNPVANQVLCNGANSTPINFTSPTTGGTIVYNWTNDQPSIGLAAAGSGNIPTFVAINTGSTPVVATITVTPAYTNGAVTCNGTPITFTITVNPPPVINPVANQVVCNNSPTTTINFTSPSSGGVIVYNWTNNTPSIGLAASGTGDILSFNAINTGTAPVVATITVIMSYTNAGITCVSLPLSFTITVNPTPDVNQPADQSLCAGAATAAVNFSSTVPGTVFNWTNNAPSIGLAASGTGNIPSFTAINTGNTPVVATIIVTPVYTNGGTTCTGPSKTFTITVNPTPTVAPVTNKVYCTGATTALIPFNGTAGGTVSGTVFNWTNSNTAIGLAASGTGDIAPFVTTNTTNGPLTATITVTPVGPTGCVGTPITFTIMVNPTPIVNPVANQVVCNGSPTAAINFTSPTTGPTGALSFVWSNTTPSIGLAANGTNSIPSFTAVNIGFSPVVATITVTPVYTNGGISCSGTPITFTITVNPTPDVNPVASQVLCNGSNTAAINFSGNVPGTVYNWTNSNTSIGLAASGTGNIASFVATNATNVAQVATITVTPVYTGGVSCPGVPITFTITVNPIPSVNAVANQTVCNGATVTQAFTGPVAGTVYTWTNSNTAIGLGAGGTGNLNFTATNTTAAPISGTIVVTPSYTNGGVTCTGSSITFTITVNPTPTVNTVTSQVVCNGANTATVTFSGAVAGTVYNWTNSNTTIGLAASGTGNIASFVATNTTTAVQTATIVVTPSYTNGGTTCTGTPVTFTITVNPTPTVNTVANQTVCAGGSTTAVTFAGTVAGTTYTWTNNNTSIGLGASGTNIIPSFTAINSGTTPVTATITVTPVFTNGGTSCPGTPTTFTITVNPTANVNVPANQVLCNGATTTAITFTGTVAGTTYSWTNSNTAIGLAASGTGNIAAFTATNTTAAPITATITVTPSAAGCAGTPVTFTITVNPTPSVTAIANQSVCAGSLTTAVTIGGPVAGTVYTWTNNNTSIGLGASGTGTIPAFVAINPTTSPITATITITPVSAAGCVGAASTFTITVNPLPNIIFTNLPPRVCLTDTLVNLATKVSPAGGTWSGNGVTGGVFSATAAGVGVHVLSYTVTTGACTTVRYFTVTVNDCIERHNVFKYAIRLFPNPNNGRFNIQFNSDKYKEFKVKIVNARGQEVGYYEFKNLVYGQIIPFDLYKLAGGQYYLYVYNTQESGVFPFIIAR